MTLGQVFLDDENVLPLCAAHYKPNGMLRMKACFLLVTGTELLGKDQCCKQNPLSMATGSSTCKCIKERTGLMFLCVFYIFTVL